MKTQSKDTNPQIEKVQISILKKQSIAQKFAQVCSLSQTTIQLSISYYIGGSIASSVFGFLRSTMDIDIIADIRPISHTTPKKAT